jgi:hypothetical protein
VYRRANLSRTFVLVVALLLAAVSTGAFACQLHRADLQGGSHAILQAPCSRHPGGAFHIGQAGAEREQTGIGAIDLDRTNVALIGTTTPLLVWRHRKTERI